MFPSEVDLKQHEISHTISEGSVCGDKLEKRKLKERVNNSENDLSKTFNKFFKLKVKNIATYT